MCAFTSLGVGLLALVVTSNGYSCDFECVNLPYRPACAINKFGEMKVLVHRCHFKELMCREPRSYWRFTQYKCYKFNLPSNFPKDVQKHDVPHAVRPVTVPPPRPAVTGIPRPPPAKPTERYPYLGNKIDYGHNWLWDFNAKPILSAIFKYNYF